MLGEDFAPQEREESLHVLSIKVAAWGRRGDEEHRPIDFWIVFWKGGRMPLVPHGWRVLANLRYDGEHVGLENLATIVGRRRRKECGTGDDAVETGSLTDILARVLRIVCNGGDTTQFELGRVPVLVCTCPAEERQPLAVQTTALLGRTRGTPENEAEARLVRGRGREDRLGRRRVRHRCTALGRKRSAGVCKRYPTGQRTTNDYRSWGRLGSDCG
jgi:hypothetical protein